MSLRPMSHTLELYAPRECILEEARDLIKTNFPKEMTNYDVKPKALGADSREILSVQFRYVMELVFVREGEQKMSETGDVASQIYNLLYRSGPTRRMVLRGSVFDATSEEPFPWYTEKMFLGAAPC